MVYLVLNLLGSVQSTVNLYLTAANKILLRYLCDLSYSVAP
jgi:hypothetical protein